MNETRDIKHGRDWEALPEIFGVASLAEFLSIGNAKAYELVRQDSFPSWRIGKCYRISKDALRKWVNNQSRIELEKDRRNWREGMAVPYE